VCVCVCNENVFAEYFVMSGLAKTIQEAITGNMYSVVALADEIENLYTEVKKLNESVEELKKEIKNKKRSRSPLPPSPSHAVATDAEEKKQPCVGCGRKIKTSDQCLHCGGGTADDEKHVASSSSSSSSSTSYLVPVVESKDQHTESFIKITTKGDNRKFNNPVLIHGSHGIDLHGENIFTKSISNKVKVHEIIKDLVVDQGDPRLPLTMITLAAHSVDFADLKEARVWFENEYPGAEVDLCVHPTILALVLAKSTPTLRFTTTTTTTTTTTAAAAAGGAV
jgi:hypothetical protein